MPEIHKLPTATAWLLALLLPTAPGTGSAEPSAVNWGPIIEVASGGGEKGPWRMNRSRFHYVDDPTVAVNGDGIIGVAFADLTRHDIFFQAYDPDGRQRLDAPVNVSRSPAIFSWLPRMVITSGDPAQIYLLWQEIVFSGGSHGGEIFFARSEDGGKSFDDPVNLSDSRPGDGKGRLSSRYWDNGSLDLVSGPDGTLYAAWTEYEGNLWLRRSTNGGKSFTHALRIAGGNDNAPARGPSIAVAPGNTVHIAFAVGEDPAANIRVAKSTNGGRTFSAARAVLKSDGHSDAPKLAVDNEGTLHLVYAESPAGPWQRYHIRHARSKNGGRSFDTPKRIAIPDPDTFSGAHYPSLSAAAGGRLYLLFELFREGEHRSRGLGFTYSDDNGESFARPVRLPAGIDRRDGINGSQQGLLMRKLATNDKGAIAVVNSTFVSGKSSHVWLSIAARK